MLNVKVYSEGRKHQNVVTPNCPITLSGHHIYLYYSFSAICFIPSKLEVSSQILFDSVSSKQHQLLYDYFI